VWCFLILAKQEHKGQQTSAYQFILDQLLLSVIFVRDTECVTLSINSALIRRTFFARNHVLLIKTATMFGFIRSNINIFNIS